MLGKYYKSCQEKFSPVDGKEFKMSGQENLHTLLDYFNFEYQQLFLKNNATMVNGSINYIMPPSVETNLRNMTKNSHVNVSCSNYVVGFINPACSDEESFDHGFDKFYVYDDGKVIDPNDRLTDKKDFPVQYYPLFTPKYGNFVVTG